jgi:hypothetical protein
MSESIAIPNSAEKQQQADTSPGAVFDWGVGPLLNLQADMLAGAEATVSDWLRRRHEAIADTRQLIARMRLGVDPGEALEAQRDWVTRSLQRLAADSDAYHSRARHLLDRVPSWFPPGGWIWFPRDEGAEASASQAAATRAAGKPLRGVASRSD